MTRLQTSPFPGRIQATDRGHSAHGDHPAGRAEIMDPRGCGDIVEEIRDAEAALLVLAREREAGQLALAAGVERIASVIAMWSMRGNTGRRSMLRHSGLAQTGKISALGQSAKLWSEICGGFQSGDVPITIVGAQPAGFGEFGGGALGLAVKAEGRCTNPICQHQTPSSGSRGLSRIARCTKRDRLLYRSGVELALAKSVQCDHPVGIARERGLVFGYGFCEAAPSAQAGCGATRPTPARPSLLRAQCQPRACRSYYRGPGTRARPPNSSALRRT